MQIAICCSMQEDADHGTYRTYGLKMGDVRVDDISTHWRTVARLRRKLIKNQVSPVHLWMWWRTFWRRVRLVYPMEKFTTRENGFCPGDSRDGAVFSCGGQSAWG